MYWKPKNSASNSLQYFIVNKKMNSHNVFIFNFNEKPDFV